MDVEGAEVRGMGEPLLSKPPTSVPLAAMELKVSTQDVEGMIGQLGSTTRKLTGRGRYLAWGIV